MSHHEREYYCLEKTRCLNKHERERVRRILKKRAFGKNPDKLAKREWFLVEFGLSTGLRVSEICNVRICDLMLDSKRPLVFVKNGKGNKDRKVELDLEFRETAKSFLQIKSEIKEPACPDSPLFYSEKSDGKYSSRALEFMFKRCLRLSGLLMDFSIHNLRHSYAVALYKATKFNIRYVQKQLGHSSLRVTEIYLQTLMSELQAPLKKLF